jgi:hypothetical protein
MVLASVATVSATTVQDDGFSNEPVLSYEEQHSLPANGTVSIAGSDVRTTVAGVYVADSVQGVAIITDQSTVKSNLGLSSAEKPMVIVYDTDEEKSVHAMACIDAAIEAMGGGSYVTSLYVDLGAKLNGKWEDLSEGSVNMEVGLPKTADTSKTYSIVCVQPGGVVTVFDDQDTNPKTVTFEVEAGIGTYALVAK